MNSLIRGVLGKPFLRESLVALIVVAVIALQSCSDATSPEPEDALAFAELSLELGLARETTVELRNVGSTPVGPIGLVGSAVRIAGGGVDPEARLTIAPSEIPTLNPGSARAVTLSVVLPGCAAGGRYEASVSASLSGTVVTSVDIGFDATDPEALEVSSVGFEGAPSQSRQGDVTALSVTVRDARGSVVNEACTRWSVDPVDAGFVNARGQFVGYAPGVATVVVAAGDRADSALITVTPRNLSGSFTIVGQGEQHGRFTSDLWVHPQVDVVYTGTWGSRSGGFGNTLYVWDISDPAAPVRIDSVFVDARVLNDVKIRSDGALAIITHEVSNDQQNGVTLLDLTDPAHPTVISRFTNSLEPGIHNAWLEGDYALLVVDNAVSSSGLRVLDISIPQTPEVVARFYAGSSFLHDVYVRDGLAFLSHWDAGLVILDVGNGIAGGSITNPVEVSRVRTAGGETHNAWYWPAGGYVFVGEEDFFTPGVMHVVDVRDLRNPREVATFRVADTTPHNFWLDEDRAVLYLAWYANGIRALDVSGDLLGELDRQGREVVGLQFAGEGDPCPGDAARTTCAWAPQLRDGLLYVADMNTGLWVLRPEF